MPQFSVWKNIGMLYLWQPVHYPIIDFIQMKEQIQKLIAAGRLEEALELLAKTTDQAILLQARFADGKRQYNTGQLTFSEWSQVQAKVNYAALEMVNQTKLATDFGTVSQTGDGDDNIARAGTGDGRKSADGKRKVFISYSQKDLETAEKVVDYLRRKGLDPLIDNEVLKPGENIQDFVTRAMKENSVVLFLVSANSLLSGWVGLEIIMSNYAKDLLETQLLPVALDKSWLNTEDTTDLLIALKKEIDKQYEQRKKRAEINASSADIDRKLRRLESHFQNLPEFCSYLDSVLTLDLSYKFEENLDKVVLAVR